MAEPTSGDVDREVEEARRVEPFFREIEHSGTLPRGTDAVDAASAVLCTLSLRLYGGEAARFVSAVPSGIQALIRPCALHRESRPALFDREEFVRRVGDHLEMWTGEAERLIRAVLHALQHRMGRDVAKQLEHELPGDLRELWR